MRELLSLFPKPSHYAGIEEGACIKNPLNMGLRIALAFPDAYEVGMSYLGQKILYEIVNSNPRWWAERVMAPEKEVAAILRDRHVPLATLESDTPLAELNAVCFSITHEMCYTDVLHMLDLAGIPFRAADRGDSLTDTPLIIAGGGAMLGAEPLAPFLDLAALGDGEEVLPEILQLLERGLTENWSRKKFLSEARHIAGVYVPSLFQPDEHGHLVPVCEDYRPARRIVADLDRAPYPEKQVIPVGAVHNRLALEIARGCVRGCRFCHAGMIYRPARERSLENLDHLLNKCLAASGFEEVSFLALSAGDFTALKTLYGNVYERCSREQVTLSLPSLRVGSVDDDIMAKMSALRRTGCTLAPEAGSQRLRDVINKGITEEALLLHARKLLEHGWKQVKLYFMIGLPTETDTDLEEIANLCRKVRDAGGKGAPRLQVTASLSPFVPKPFTPFQWAEQIGRDEINRRVQYVLSLFKQEKSLSLRWHAPDVSHVEGILSRGGRELADVIEKAYRKGAIFCGWTEFFELHPWLEALAECGFSPEKLIAAKTPGDYLPWNHIEAGVDEKFLRSEWQRAMDGRPTSPCSPSHCRQCGVCDTSARKSRLPHAPATGNTHGLRLNFSQRDQKEIVSGSSATDVGKKCDAQNRPNLNPLLAGRAAHYRLWHRKTGRYAFLSQLELQAVITRALRRASIPVAFSQGFHPMPLLSFGRALPVGVQSEMEWFALTLHSPLAAGQLRTRLNLYLPDDMKISLTEPVDKKHRTEQAIAEDFSLFFKDSSLTAMAADCFTSFSALETCIYSRETKKGAKNMDIRPMLLKWRLVSRPTGDLAIDFCASWDENYLSPLVLCRTILGNMASTVELDTQISLLKTAQIFSNGNKYPQNKKNLS